MITSTEATGPSNGATSMIAAWAYHAAVRRAALATLIDRPRSQLHPSRGRFEEADVLDLVDAARRLERGIAAPIADGEDLSARMTVSLAVSALGLLDALILREVERPYAIELVADVIWRLARAWGSLGREVLRVYHWTDPRHTPRAPAFPLCPAASRREPRPHEPEILVASSCPVAQYLIGHGAADLCKRAWCDAVYPIAERAGQTIDRSATLADGAPACRLHWSRRW